MCRAGVTTIPIRSKRGGAWVQREMTHQQLWLNRSQGGRMQGGETHGSPVGMGVPGMDGFSSSPSQWRPHPSGLGSSVVHLQTYWPPSYWTRGTQPLSPRHCLGSWDVSQVRAVESSGGITRHPLCMLAASMHVPCLLPHFLMCRVETVTSLPEKLAGPLTLPCQSPCE